MRRRLFTLASAVSLLLCMATAVLWMCCSATARFHLHSRDFHLHSRGLSALSVDWDRSLRVTGSTYFPTPQFIEWPDTSYGMDPRLPAWRAARATKVRRFVGFGFQVSHELDSVSNAGRAYEIDRGISKALVIPAWFLLITTAILPILWVTSRFRLPRPGQCPTCRYDLTGNVSGTCTECGTAVAGKVVA